jgi:hypothetical protein
MAEGIMQIRISTLRSQGIRCNRGLEIQFLKTKQTEARVNDKPSSDPIWHQMIVSDSEGLSGASVVAFVEPIIRKLGATAVVTSDLVGACPGLQDYEGRVLSADDFLAKARSATQYDWAFFFLYIRTPIPSEESLGNEREEMLRANLTIRLADDYYFYVDSRHQKLMSDLRRMHADADYKASKFAELDIPD